MNLDPSVMLSGMVVSALGLAVFIHGKRAERLNGVLLGMALMGLPLLVHSLLWMWIGAGACVAGLFVLPSDG